MPKTQQAIVPVFNPALIFQPKQGDIFDLVVDGLSTWVGGGGGRGGAKLLDVDELIPTPDGFVPNGSLEDGDAVFGEDGLPHCVVHAHPLVEEEAFRVSFDDGTSTVVHGGHLWTTFTRLDRKALGRTSEEFRAQRRATRKSRGKTPTTFKAAPQLVGKNIKPVRLGAVRTTDEIAATLFAPSGHHGDGFELTLNHSIALAAPIQLPEGPLPIDPYVLGCWLGDGSSGGGGYTCHYEDQEIIQRIRAVGFQVTQARGNLFEDGWHIQGIARTLRQLRLLFNKHIPHEYLWASQDQRTALLQGLCDTDGTCCADGQTQFVNTNKLLTEGTYHLAASLGLKPFWAERRAKLYGKDCGPCYTVSWTANFPAFRLKRKLDRIPIKTRATQKWRYITAVESVGKRLMRCITTDNPTGLYLFGKNFNVTHNSGAIHRTMLGRRLMHPGTIGAIVMRNSDQVRDYHELPMLRDWPQLQPLYHKGDRTITLPFEPIDDKPVAPSLIKFTYAETLKDVIRRFRSANLFDIAVDQAEQFTEEELREMKQAVRWPGMPIGTCKFWLFFNMGGVGIDFMRKKFHDLEFNPQEDPKDFKFVHFFPYDNVEWSRPALEADGLTVEDYYSWPEEKRIHYCATRSQYGKDLMSQDEALVKRDFYGSWDVLEGAFFARSFDRNSTVIEPEIANEMIKHWWERWLAQDWARGHYCPTYWFASGEMSPSEVKRLLDWDVRLTLKVVIVYREYIAGGESAPDLPASMKAATGSTREMDEDDVAREIVNRTPQSERANMMDFFLSPDAFGKKSKHQTIAQTEGEILDAAGMPYPRQADNDRIGGWSLMSRLFMATKRKGQRGDQVLLISAECPALINSIPLAMRDPKNLSDILKTDTSAARIEMDTLDGVRYGTRSKLEPGKKPKEVENEEKLQDRIEAGMDSHSLNIYRIQLSQEAQVSETPASFGHRHTRVVRR